MYLIMWEFLVVPGQEKAFEKEYGPEGGWVRLFGQSQEYRGTELVRDAQNRRRYLTLDLWKSRAAYDLFREKQRDQYSALDKACKAFTEKETLLGTFETLGDAVPLFSPGY
jgi:heme-degrading monooxygenase HmoA